jgi:hypothetical protein
MIAAIPWFIGTFGAVCLSLVVGFVCGVAWGVNFASAKKAIEAEKGPDQLLVPQMWSPEKIMQSIRASSTDGLPVVPETPQTYRGPSTAPPVRIPGLEDG